MIAIKDIEEMPSCCYECPYFDDYCALTGKWESDTEQIRDNDCPLVEIQEPRTGYWVSKGDVYPAWKYCSNCNEPWTFDCGTPNYCPNCGAKMAESEEV